MERKERKMGLGTEKRVPQRKKEWLRNISKIFISHSNNNDANQNKFEISFYSTQNG